MKGMIITMLKPFFLQNSTSNEINPVVCGINHCQSGEVYPGHYIQRYVLHYVINGCGKYLLNDNEYQVNKGDVFISHKGDFTSYIADKHQPFTYIWISFECSEAFTKLLSQKVFSAFWAQHIFKKIYNCKNFATPEWVICANLYEFFTELASRQNSSIIFKKEYVSMALNYIESNYSEYIKIEEIAAALGISRNHFFKVFKQATGISPQKYLISYRLNKATELLKEQKYTQKEIALRIGYPDVYTFSRMFKKKYGVSPGKYAKNKK